MNFKRLLLKKLKEVFLISSDHWKKLHEKLMKDKTIEKFEKVHINSIFLRLIQSLPLIFFCLKKAFQGIRPATLSMEFRNTTSLFAEKYLTKVRKYNDFLATIMFLESHPRVNRQLLDYAITIAMIRRKDTSLDVPNPIEVNQCSKSVPVYLI